MIPYWVRRLCTNLERVPVIKTLRCRRDRVDVRYKTGSVTRYVFRGNKRHCRSKRINPRKAYLDSLIKIGQQHQWHPLGPNQKALSPYFMVPRSSINGSSFMQQEILTAELTYRIINNGWVPCMYSDLAIQKELSKIKKYDKVYARNRLNACGARLGRPIIETYFDIKNCIRRNRGCPYKSRKDSRLEKCFKIPQLVSAVLMVLIRAKYDINLQSVMRAMYQKGRGPSWPSPALYRKIFEHAKCSTARSYYDLDPYLGSKAIACAVGGSKYATEGDSLYNSAIDKGFYDAIGIYDIPFRPPFDVLLADNNFYPLSVVDMKKVLGMDFNSLILFVRRYQYGAVRKIRKPNKIIDLITSVAYQRPDDFIFVYHNQR